MPLIKFTTNMQLPEERMEELGRKLAKGLCSVTGEPESATKVELAGGRALRSGGGSEDRAAHIEIRNSEVAKPQADSLTQALCPVVEDVLAIAKEKVYIAVLTNRNSMWRAN